MKRAKMAQKTKVENVENHRFVMRVDAPDIWHTNAHLMLDGIQSLPGPRKVVDMEKMAKERMHRKRASLAKVVRKESAKVLAKEVK